VEIVTFALLNKKKMRFHTRKWIKPEDLNPNGTLFGGQLLAWIDEELALYSIMGEPKSSDQIHVGN
jgi:acyl-CoA hydrolase